MLLNGGNIEGLFRAAWMQSGAPLPLGSYKHGQWQYDALVESAGCTGKADTLACLRTAPFDSIMSGILKIPGKLSYEGLPAGWLPRFDGKFLKDDPQKLVLAGNVAKIPFVTGNDDDEGTLFSQYNLNITTDSEFRDYITEFYLPNATASEIDTVLKMYPSDPAQGSPFDTGSNNTLSPEYKRISAFQGDFIFQGPRRFFLQERFSFQKTWSYLYNRGKLASPLGAYHSIEMSNMYGTGNGTEMQDYLINFAYHLDPNGPSLTAWPLWTSKLPNLLTFLDGSVPIIITNDTYRTEAMGSLTQLSLKYPL